MGDLMGYDDWLQAQNCLLGAALLDPELVPRIVTELTPEDFTGPALQVYKAMADLFRRSQSNSEVDPVAVANYLGGTPESRRLVGDLMGCSPMATEIPMYLNIVRERSKLSRLRDMGRLLSTSVSLEDAVETADKISEQLVERSGLKSYGPGDMLATFEARHKATPERIDWGLRAVGDYVRLRKGMFVILGAEPSGGKTAFALEQMWAFSAKRRVLFVSLETDQDLIFDRMVSGLAGIPMDSLMDGKLTPQQWQAYNEARSEIASRNFKILPGSGIGLAGIKAAAIGCRADIVIIDYLQIIQTPGNRLGRYEKITEISMGLHVLAQSTGMIVIALSQVTNRDPKLQNTPLNIHSARESGQIEADADAILMLDKYVEKDLRDSGCKANRVLRIVKNKNGRCCNIPLSFDGRFQRFSRAYVPDPNWERIQEEKRRNAPPLDDYQQLPMDTEVPF